MNIDEFAVIIDSNVTVTWNNEVRIGKDIPKNIIQAAGVSKRCLICKDLPFVAKLPRLRSRDIFENACQNEVNFYQNSNNYRIQKILLPSEYWFTTSNNVPIYKQTKISFVVSGMPHFKYIKYHKMTEKISDDLMYRVRCSIKEDDRSIDTLWLKMIWLLYGEKFMRSAIKWICDNHVNDLHSSNLGYLNDRPVIMDYSGYHG